MKKILSKLSKILISIVTVFSLQMPVITIHADGLDINTAISQIIGSYQSSSTYHYSYAGGASFDAILTSDSASELYNIGLDCTSGTLAIVSKAIRNAGGDPYKYFGNCRGKLNAVLPFDLSNYFTNMEIISNGPVDVSTLIPGDILVYGYTGGAGHMNVYAGNGYTFDFSSNGNGSNGNYKAFANYITYRTSAGSLEDSHPLTRVMRLTLNKTITYEVNKRSICSDVSNAAMYSLAGAVFGVYTSSDCNENSRIDTLTTDSNGYASGSKSVDSNVNTIYMKELQAPQNFELSDTSVHESNVIENHASFEFVDKPVYADASIMINKVDQEGKENAASLENTEFTMSYYDTYDDVTTLTPTASWTIKTLKEVVNDVTSYVARIDEAHLVSGSFITNEEGKPVIPLGTLEVKEVKPSSHYTIEGGYLENGDPISFKDGDSLFIQITEENQNVVMKMNSSSTSASYTKQERPIRGAFSIQKKDKDVLNDSAQLNTNGVRSQGTATFANAEFDLYYLGDGTDNNVSIMLDHDGDGLGDGSEYLPSDTTPITHITLDASGYYQTPNNTYLGYGNYLLKETKAPLGYSIYDENGNINTISFTVNQDKQTLYLDAIEKVYEGDIQITKTISTNNTSSFTKPEVGAVFDIVLKKYVLLEANGQEITRETVISAYDKANSYTGKDESNHEVIGYTNMEYDQITTDINGVAKSKKLAYGEYCLVQVSGNSENKVIQDVKEFSIYQEHQETLFFSATNNTKGYILKMFKKDADTGQHVSLTSSAFKIHMLEDADGNDVSSKTTYDTSLQSRLVNGYVTQTLGENDEKTVYDVFMTASSNQSEQLEQGVFYGVNNSSKDNVLASSCTPIELLPGLYQLEEVITSDGFVTSEPVKFKISADSITRINEVKQNIIEVEFPNKLLKGSVTIQKQINTWDEADKSFLSYDFNQFGFTLYAKEDITSSDDGSVIVKKDEIAKKITSDPTKPYEEYGEVFANEEGKVTFEALPLGKYYLKETTYPKGYVPFKDEITIEVSQSMYDHTIDTKTTLPLGLGDVTDRSVKADDVFITIDNQETNAYTWINDVSKTKISKQDITDSKELPGAKLQLKGDGVDLSWTSGERPLYIEGLAPGEYTLRETASPNGYYYHEDITFTIYEDGSMQKVEMKDSPIHYQIQKVDDDGKPVEGVQLKLFDVTDRENKVEVELPNDGITTKEPISLNGVLQCEHQYELQEINITEGLYKADSITFEVPKVSDEECITITMVDLKTAVSILKVDQNGKAVKGAKLEILSATKNEDGTFTIDENNVLTTIETTNEAIDISSYVKGSNDNDTFWYVVREVNTPFGFETMEDFFFTVTGTKENKQLIELTDIRKDFFVEVTKVDANDTNVVLKGAEITLYQKDGNVALDIDGKQCVQTTNENGKVLFNVLYDEGYYVKETKAPNGYQKNDDTFKITFSETYEFTKEDPIKITIKDKKNTVNTADTSHIGFYMASMTLALIIGMLLVKQRFFQ